MPLHLAPSPVTRLHRAIAVRYAARDADRYAEASSTEKALVRARSASAARMVRPAGNASSGADALVAHQVTVPPLEPLVPQLEAAASSKVPAESVSFTPLRLMVAVVLVTKNSGPLRAVSDPPDWV